MPELLGLVEVRALAIVEKGPVRIGPLLLTHYRLKIWLLRYTLSKHRDPLHEFRVGRDSWLKLIGHCDHEPDR
jgi:hypothetical protein